MEPFIVLGIIISAFFLIVGSLILLFGKRNTVAKYLIMGDERDYKNKGVRLGHYVLFNFKLIFFSAMFGSIISFVIYLISELDLVEGILKVLGILFGIVIVCVLINLLIKAGYMVFIKYHPHLDPIKIKEEKARLRQKEQDKEKLVKARARARKLKLKNKKNR